MYELEIEIVFVLAFVVLPWIYMLEFAKGRKYDFICAFIGYYVILGFVSIAFLSIIIGKLELLPDVISSCVIAMLTLALVWVELSKRPELKMLDFIPTAHFHIADEGVEWRADREPGQLSEPSKLLGVIEASYKNPNLKFNEKFSFTVDISNIGYEEIVVHEFIVFVDGKITRRDCLDKGLRTQERLGINTYFLGVGPGFHKVRLQVLATTVSVSKEVWFFISEDLRKLEYLEVYRWKRLIGQGLERKLTFKSDRTPE